MSRAGRVLKVVQRHEPVSPSVCIWAQSVTDEIDEFLAEYDEGGEG